MGSTPTVEQEAARDAFVEGADLALVAGAGTGKTSSLVLMGEATRRRGIYLAFNKSIAAEAAGRFGRNVQCRTAHSVAFNAVGRPYQDRLNGSRRIPAWKAADLLGIRRSLQVDSRTIAPKHQARLVMGMVVRFCRSADQQISARHLEWVNGLNEAEQAYVARTLLPYARRAWDDITRTDGALRFEHDHYMKMWALREPKLDADFVLLDEAQDTNPVLEQCRLYRIEASSAIPSAPSPPSRNSVSTIRDAAAATSRSVKPFGTPPAGHQSRRPTAT